MRRILHCEPAPSSTRWVVQSAFAIGVVIVFLWIVRDSDVGSAPLTGLGDLRVIGVTEGRLHEPPGRSGKLLWLPSVWRQSLARKLGYDGMVGPAQGSCDETLLWCEWSLTNTLAPGGWFEPILVDKGGQVIALGTFPAAGGSTGRRIEPVGFRPLHLKPGTVLEVRRFQPGSPYRETVGRLAIANL